MLDHLLLPWSYTGNGAAAREDQVARAWGSGSIRPLWESDINCDLLNSADWQDRAPCVQAFAAILKDWPDGAALSQWAEGHAGSHQT